MKRLLSLFLVFIIAASLVIPHHSASAAAIKISKSNLILYVGDSTSLKITGTTKSVKWSSFVWH